VVEWRNLERSDVVCELFGGYVTFQAVFFEGSSDILSTTATTFGYCRDLDGGATATVGVQVSPDVATMLLPHRRARRWHLAAVDARTGAAAGDRRDAGLPGFGTVSVGASADMSFAVQNVGTGTLTGAAKTAAPFSIVSVARTRWPRGRPRPSRSLQPDVGRHFVGGVTFTAATILRSVRESARPRTSRPILPQRSASSRRTGRRWPWGHGRTRRASS
jgi:hypothetical protein